MLTCILSITAASWIILFIAMLFWQFRTIKVIYHALQYYDIKKFYNSALKIDDSEIDNLTWHEVQQKIREVQSEQQMCIHKAQLIELDILNRDLLQKYVLETDAVIHLAAIVGYPACDKDPELAASVNAQGTKILCNLVKFLLSIVSIVLGRPEPPSPYQYNAPSPHNTEYPVNHQ